MKPASTKLRPASTVPPHVAGRSISHKPEPAPPEAELSDGQKREALIRLAAYSFYERRGFVGGHELEDWLQAEMEVDRQRAEVAKPAPAK
jgi:hypothetical protein